MTSADRDETGRSPDRQLDLRGLRCPLPVLKIRKSLLEMSAGETLLALVDDPLAAIDVPHFLSQSGAGRMTASEPVAAAIAYRIVKESS